MNNWFKVAFACYTMELESSKKPSQPIACASDGPFVLHMKVLFTQCT